MTNLLTTYAAAASTSGGHVDPSVFTLDQLARIRGAMWTVRGPWRFGPRPGDPSNITALEFIHSYGDPLNASNLNAEQQAMLATYKGFGFTHNAFGPPCAASYHGQYPDFDFLASPALFDKWLDWVQMFWDQGLAPICFGGKDGATPDEIIALYDPLIRGNARAQRLIRIFAPTGWEPTQYGWSSRSWAKLCAWAREILPNALILIHTVADTDAPVGEDALYKDYDNAAGWAFITPHIHGWLTQSGLFGDSRQHPDPNQPDKYALDLWRDKWRRALRGSYYDRFHLGYAGWPSTSAWGDRPIKVYAAEFCSYWAYWNNRPYAEGVMWGDAAMAGGGCDGYLDSGSVAVGPR